MLKKLKYPRAPKNMSTEMGSGEVKRREDWRGRAEVLFFVEKKSIAAVSKELSISRKSIGVHLKKLPGYQQEIENRRQKAKQNRRDYQRQWAWKARANRYNQVTAETIRQEHDTAARVLSYEKI